MSYKSAFLMERSVELNPVKETGITYQLLVVECTGGHRGRDSSLTRVLHQRLNTGKRNHTQALQYLSSSSQSAVRFTYRANRDCSDASSKKNTENSHVCLLQRSQQCLRFAKTPKSTNNIFVSSFVSSKELQETSETKLILYDT